MFSVKIVFASAPPSFINRSKNYLKAIQNSSQQAIESENNSNEVTEQSTHILSHVASGNNLGIAKGESPKVVPMRYIDGVRYQIKCP